MLEQNRWCSLAAVALDLIAGQTRIIPICMGRSLNSDMSALEFLKVKPVNELVNLVVMEKTTVASFTMLHTTPPATLLVLTLGLVVQTRSYLIGKWLIFLIPLPHFLAMSVCLPIKHDDLNLKGRGTS